MTDSDDVVQAIPTQRTPLRSAVGHPVRWARERRAAVPAVPEPRVDEVPEHIDTAYHWPDGSWTYTHH